MPDPTEIVLTSCFIIALGLFTTTAITRKLLVRKTAVAPPFEVALDNAGSPYQTPVSNDLPPPLPAGKVPTWLYNPFDLLGLGAIFLVFFSLAIASVRTARTENLVLDPKALVFSIGFQFAIAGAVAFIVTRRTSLVEWLGLRWRSWPWVLLIAPGTVALMWLFFGILQATGYMKWMESLGVESVQDTVKLLQTSQDPLILGLMTIAAVLAAPVCEEIVFRGYFYPAARKFAGPWVAGICSALIFASAHGSLSALLPLFIFGCALVFIYEKTGSLWAPIAVHFCFNGATVLIQLIARAYHLPLNSVQ